MNLVREVTNGGRNLPVALLEREVSGVEEAHLRLWEVTQSGYIPREEAPNTCLAALAVLPSRS